MSSRQTLVTRAAAVLAVGLGVLTAVLALLGAWVAATIAGAALLSGVALVALELRSRTVEAAAAARAAAEEQAVVSRQLRLLVGLGDPVAEEAQDALLARIEALERRVVEGITGVDVRTAELRDEVRARSGAASTADE